MKVIGTRVSNCVGYIISSQSRKYLFTKIYFPCKKENRRIQDRYQNYMYKQIEKNFFYLMKMKIGLRNSSFRGPKLPTTSNGYCIQEIDEKNMYCFI